MMKQFLDNSYLFGGNAPFVEELYEKYLGEPGRRARGVARLFRQAAAAAGRCGEGRRARARSSNPLRMQRKGGCRARAAPARDAGPQAGLGASSWSPSTASAAACSPTSIRCKRQQKPHIPELEPGYYDLTDADMDTVFNTGSFIGPAEQAPLREIIRGLQETYCGSLGVEYMYISSRVEKRWIQERLEPVRSRPNFAPDYKKHILERLTAAEGLERYLHTRYVGQKRFSLEGGETLIPVLDNLLQRAGEAGVQELVIGMAHRGRLNVLVNTLGKMPKDLFSEFEGKHDDALTAGDVKYHQGFSSDINTPGGPMHLTLAFNPSHLEIVNPVVEGSVRARQHRRKDRRGRRRCCRC